MKAVGKWVVTTDTLDGHRCLKHTVTNELSAFGSKGEVYRRDNYLYTARIWSKVPGINLRGARFDRGDELLVHFPSSALAKYLKLLGVPASPQIQVEHSKVLR